MKVDVEPEAPLKLQRADNEWRHDPVDDAWTIVARNRRLLRPREVAPDPHEGRVRESRHCPLCERDIQHLGEHVIDCRHVSVSGHITERGDDRISSSEGEPVEGSGAHGPVPVVALVSPTPLLFIEDASPSDAPFTSSGGLGAHEILAPVGPGFCRLPPSRWGPDVCAALFALFAARHRDLARDLRLQSLSFIALPPGAARLPHAHAALLATPFAPRPALPEERCAVRQDLRQAREAGRVLLEEDGLSVWVPWAPRSSVHLRVAVAHDRLPPEQADVLRYGRVIARVLAATDRALGAARATFSITRLGLRPDEGRIAPLVADIEAPYDADAPLAGALGHRVCSLPPEDLVELLKPALDEVAARELSVPTPSRSPESLAPNVESVR